MKAALTLLLWMAMAIALQRLVSTALRALLLSYAPLSGDGSDSMVLQRSLMTPGDRNNLAVWALNLLGGIALWFAARGHKVWIGPGCAALFAALAWELWTWERVAVGVRRVCWRRGWRRGVRSVPVSQLAEVAVVERPLGWLAGDWGAKLGSCYLRLQLRTGDAVKLPRTSVWRGLATLEEMANFLRMQMGVADEEKRRVAREKRRSARPEAPLAPKQQEALRRRLMALRREGGAPASGAAAPPPESVPPADSLSASAWPSDSELQSQPPESDDPRSRPGPPSRA